MAMMMIISRSYSPTNLLRRTDGWQKSHCRGGWYQKPIWWPEFIKRGLFLRHVFFFLHNCLFVLIWHSLTSYVWRLATFTMNELINKSIYDGWDKTSWCFFDQRKTKLPEFMFPPTIISNTQYVLVYVWIQYTVYSIHISICMNMNAWIELMMFVTPLQVCSAAIDPGMNSPEKINCPHFP